MTEIYCDSCKGLQAYGHKRMEIPVHLWSQADEVGYCIKDAEGFIPTSGRTDTIDLCYRCYNKANIAAVMVIKGSSDD